MWFNVKHAIDPYALVDRTSDYGVYVNFRFGSSASYEWTPNCTFFHCQALIPCRDKLCPKIVQAANTLDSDIKSRSKQERIEKCLVSHTATLGLFPLQVNKCAAAIFNESIACILMIPLSQRIFGLVIFL